MMDISPIELGLTNELPRELRPAASSFTVLLMDLLADKLKITEAQDRIEREPLLSVLLYILAGQQIKLSDQAQITFGSNNQLGNVTIGDVAGRDLINLNFTINQYYPPPSHSTSHPKMLLAETCPYPGLKPFDEQHSTGFFGREHEIDQLSSQLLHQHVLTLIGLSGSGKTSFLCAGLLPTLQRSPLFEPGTWCILPMIRPDNDLQAALKNLLGSLDQPAQSIKALLKKQPAATRLMLVIDAFEELFTQQSEVDIEASDSVLASLSAVPGLTIVITMRAEYYHRLLSDLPLCGAYLRSGLVPLTMLGAEGLARAIIEPALGAGLRVETELVAELVLDCIGDRRAAAILPFLQQTLVLIWRDRNADLLTVKSYRDLGEAPSNNKPARNGLQVALGTGADAALSKLLTQAPNQLPEQQQLVRRMFLRLLQFAPDAAITRRSQPVIALRSDDDPPDLFDLVLRNLSGSLLIIAHADDAEKRKVDLIHEALIDSWEPLIQWVSMYREAELLRRELEQRSQRWSGSLHSDELLNSTMLIRATIWEREYAEVVGMSATLRSYLATSRSTQRLRQFERFITPVAAVFAVSLLVFLFWQGYQYNLYRESRILNPLVRIDAGTLTLGPASGPDQDPFTSRSIMIAAFQMDKYEVSNGQYCRCRKVGKCPTAPAYEQEDVCNPSIAHLPVTNVRLQQANDFCQWMGGHVPKEMHWEWAARAPDGRIYAGIEASRKELPNDKGVNINNAHHGRPIDVNQLNDLSATNLIGLTGNVSEWTLTWFMPYLDQEYPRLWTDPVAAAELIVIRGGNAQSDFIGSQATFRMGQAPGSENRLLGFRCQYDSPNP